MEGGIIVLPTPSEGPSWMVNLYSKSPHSRDKGGQTFPDEPTTYIALLNWLIHGILQPDHMQRSGIDNLYGMDHD